MVPYREGYLVWHCVERPEVIFEDVFEVPVIRGKGAYVIPPEFTECIETESIRCVSLMSNGGPARITYAIDGTDLQIGVREPLWRRVLFGMAGIQVRSVTVRIEGVRKDFGGVRYLSATRAEYEANERFYRLQRYGVRR
ncbi:MAG: hypothetical protein AAF357_09345 [Verrucomicrobiota bacterium]